MWGSDLNGFHQSGPCTFSQQRPSLSCTFTGRLGSNKTLNCQLKPHNIVFKLLTWSASPTQCWVTEWRPVIGTMQVWSSLTSRLTW